MMEAAERSSAHVARRSTQPEGSAVSTSPVSKVGQLGLSKVQPGRYVLTLIVIDPLADKKQQRVSRSVGFTVVD